VECKTFIKLLIKLNNNNRIINIIITYIGKNEKDGACSTYGGEERPVQGFGGET
jgi:hypothetical protein